MLEESPISLELLNYFDKKYGQLIAPIGLFKSCSITSANLRWPRLSILSVAPTRQFKSRTSAEMESIFPKEYYIKAGSDFTIHGLARETKGDVNKKCILVDDGTLLLTSKSKRAKDRLINAMAELLSDGEYKYCDFLRTLGLHGNCTAIVNMTLESFNRYENVLLGSTFLERFLTLFHNMPLVEQRSFIHNKDIKMAMRFDRKLRISQRTITNFKRYEEVFKGLAIDFSALSLRSFLGSFDVVKALAQAHASLNQRTKIIQDDLDAIKLARDYLINPMSPNENRIIRLFRQGKNYTDICLILGKEPKSYKPFVSRVVRRAKERGTID